MVAKINTLKILSGLLILCGHAGPTLGADVRIDSQSFSPVPALKRLDYLQIQAGVYRLREINTVVVFGDEVRGNYATFHRLESPGILSGKDSARTIFQAKIGSPSDRYEAYTNKWHLPLELYFSEKKPGRPYITSFSDYYLRVNSSPGFEDFLAWLPSPQTNEGFDIALFLSHPLNAQGFRRYNQKELQATNSLWKEGEVLIITTDIILAGGQDKLRVELKYELSSPGPLVF